jgi:hypothetical protein
VDVSLSLQSDPFVLSIVCRTEEAGFYLTSFKTSEHKSPDLIRERVDKDFASLYRTSLTSIAKINKTDVETLKTNIGVGLVSFEW